MPYPDNADPDHVLTISHLLATMRNGAANDRATQELEKLVAAVTESGKPGDVTLKFKVAKLKDGDTEMSVQITVKSNIPVADIPKGIYYPGEHGSLHRTDPRQMELLDDRRQARETDDRDMDRVGRGRVVDLEANRG